MLTLFMVLSRANMFIMFFFFFFPQADVFTLGYM